MGRNSDGSWSAVSMDGGMLGRLVSRGESEARAVARRWREEESLHRRRYAVERNINNHSAVRTFSYPFCGYYVEKHMALKDAWQIL